MTVEGSNGRAEPGDFPGQQGRAAFAMLAGSAGMPVAREALAEALWPTTRPLAWSTALSSVISKLRAMLAAIGADAAPSLITGGGCHVLQLAPGSWIDHDAAAASIHEAETALRADRPADAYGPSAVAHHIARRPFLPSENGTWFEERRERLGSIFIRALECRAQVYLWNHEFTLAVEAARAVVTRQPFRESGYRLLMRSHAAAGNSGEALWVYEECRKLMEEQLGVGPSRETRAMHASIVANC